MAVAFYQRGGVLRIQGFFFFALVMKVFLASQKDTLMKLLGLSSISLVAKTIILFGGEKCIG